MEWIRKNNFLKACLLLGVASYVLCFSVFRHNHIVDGVSVTHFHPFAELKHSSSNEIWAYALSGSFETVELDCNFDFDLHTFVTLVENILLGKFTQQLQFCSNSLRAPPHLS